MRPSARCGQTHSCERIDQLAAQRAELHDRRAHRLVRIRPELDRSLMRLGADIFSQRNGKSLEHIVNSLRQRPPPPRVDEHHLLFDAYAVGMNLAVPLRPPGLREDGVMT
jgi:hypothetical protein